MTLNKLYEEHQAWLEWARDLATVHWVLSEENKDDLPKMVNDVIQEILRESDEPALSKTAAKAQLCDEIARGYHHIKENFMETTSYFLMPSALEWLDRYDEVDKRT